MLNIRFQGTSHRGDPHSCGTSPSQDTGAFGSRCTRRENVIHQQNFPASDLLRMLHAKCPAEILAPLMPRQSRLGLRLADSLEKFRLQIIAIPVGTKL